MACCEKCGQPNPEGAAFCTACGYPITKSDEVTPPPPPPPPAQTEGYVPMPVVQPEEEEVPTPVVQPEEEVPTPDVQPEEEEEVSAPSAPTDEVPKSNKKKSCLIVAIIVVVVMLVLAGVIGFFVFNWAKESGLIEGDRPIVESKAEESVTTNETGYFSEDTESFSEGMESMSEEAGGVDMIYDKANQQPSFPGGTSALAQYLHDNVVYPSSANAKNVHGRVVVSFVVELDGSLSNVTVISPLDPDLDKEAIRLVQSMPRWVPGYNDDEPVRVRYRVPVLF